MSDLMAAMELTLELRRYFKAIADLFDEERAATIMRRYIVGGTSIPEPTVDRLLDALRDDYRVRAAS